ncbi:MAG: acyloxyacyl hydrolase [Flavobacteriales bacterium]|nr:acyloxyacyl hydrolase [Flavobacteriales bacterium]
MGNIFTGSGLTWIILFALLLTGYSSFSQNYRYHLGASALPGFLIAHTPDSKNLEAHTFGVEMQWTRRAITERPWAREYKDPRIGLNLLYMDLGNPDLTGRVFCIGPNFESAIIKTDRDQLRFRAGSGFGYITRKFDPFENRRNQAIGSNLNALIQFRLSWTHRFAQTPWESIFGIGGTHFSNGSFRVPNLGVNMPGLFIGLNYQFDQSEEAYDAQDTIRIPEWTVYASYAFKERSLAKQQPFHVFSIGLERIKRRSLTRQWRYGGELFFDKTHQFGKNPDGSLKNLSPDQFTEVAIFGGHQWLIYKVHLIVDLGAYLYKPSTDKFLIYERVGFKYQVSDKLYLRTTLKAHIAVADFIDWGIGYKL